MTDQDERDEGRPWHEVALEDGVSIVGDLPEFLLACKAHAVRQRGDNLEVLLIESMQWVDVTSLGKPSTTTRGNVSQINRGRPK